MARRSAAQAVKKSNGAKAKAAKPAEGSRRSFISWMSLAWVAFTASVVAAGAATTRFMFPNVLFEPPLTRRVGPPEELQLGVVDERFKDSFGVWLVREDHFNFWSAVTHVIGAVLLDASILAALFIGFSFVHERIREKL